MPAPPIYPPQFGVPPQEKLSSTWSRLQGGGVGGGGGIYKVDLHKTYQFNFSNFKFFGYEGGPIFGVPQERNVFWAV